MIADDLVRYVYSNGDPAHAAKLGSATCIKSPFSIQRPPDGLIPRNGQKIVAPWARPPYPNILLVNDESAPGPDGASIMHVEQWPKPADGGYSWSTSTSLYLRTSFGGFILVDASLVSADPSGEISRGVYQDDEDEAPDNEEAYVASWRTSMDARAKLSGASLPPDMGHRRPIGLEAPTHETVATVFGLMNCRNVQLDDATPSRQQRRAAERSGRPAPFTVRTLMVRALETRRADRSGPTAEKGTPIALHWVRGHFKHYDDEHRLFGKYTGTYWWAPHVAGDKAAGVVVKDYEVEGQ